MALIDPEKLANLAQKLVERANSVQLTLVALLAHRLKRDMGSDEWASLRTAEALDIERRARRIVAKARRGRSETQSPQ